MLRETILGKQQIQFCHFAIARDFGNDGRGTDFGDQAIPFTTAREGIGNAGQRLPSISTKSGVSGKPATARCIASMVACRILRRSISSGSARPRLQASAFSLI